MKVRIIKARSGSVANGTWERFYKVQYRKLFFWFTLETFETAEKAVDHACGIAKFDEVILVKYF